MNQIFKKSKQKKNKMNNNFQFPIYETNEKSGCRFISLDDIINKISMRDDKTPFIKAVREAGGRNELSKMIKAKRECVAWNRGVHLCDFNESEEDHKSIMYMIYDDLNKEEIITVKCYLKTLPFVIAAWESFDGKGIECLVLYEFGDVDHFEKAWIAAAKEIGIAYDDGYQTLVVNETLTFDPDVYYNPDASHFILKVSSPKRRKR